MFAKEGYPFIIMSGIVLIVLAFVPKKLMILLALLVFGLMLWFFRDPERIALHDEDAVLSAADGKIVEVSDVEVGGMKYKKVSVFMNVLDVHVNRVPYSGEVEEVNHIMGSFMNADKPEASVQNERNEIHINTDRGKMIITQVAGFVARRTVAYVSKGSPVSKGDKLGIIKFSSRVDHYLPESVKVEVRFGEKVKAGVTTIARF